MTIISGPELSISYPPQSSYFIGGDNTRSDILELPKDALRIVSVGSTGDSSGVDAFGRSRTSEQFTLGDYKHLYGINTDFIDITANNGSVSFITNESAVRLTAATQTGSYAIHQTKKYHHYMPGKSQLIESSFTFGAATSNITKRTGYFDDNNGIFLEQTGDGQLAFNIRTYTSGTADDTTNRAPQSSWNVDKCDGTGASKFNIDITKTQIFFTDFQWLGVGRVRCGFIHNGQYIVAHEYLNSNNKSVVYMTSPNLPIRCEIRNLGNITTTASMDQICATVVSEGGYTEAGRDFAATTAGLVTVSAGATLPIFAIRLKNSFNGQLNRAFARLNDVDIISTAENIKYEVKVLTSETDISGSTWTSSNSASVIEYTATITGSGIGETINAGFITSGGVGANRNSATNQYFSSPGANKNFISQNFTSSNSQVFLISATNIGAGATQVGAVIGWREIY